MAERGKRPSELFREHLANLHEIAQHNLETGKLVEGDAEVLKSADRDLMFFGETLLHFVTALEATEGPEVPAVVMQSMWGAMRSSFLIGRHGTITESARKFIASGPLASGRDRKQAKDEERKAREIEVLRSVISGRDIAKPSKFVDENLESLKRAARAADLAPPGRSTWILRMADLGFTSGRQKSNT